MMPLDSGDSALDMTSYYLAQRRAVLQRAERRDLILRRAIPVPSMHLVLRLYDRTSVPERKAACD
jgi:hypothetical protein